MWLEVSRPELSNILGRFPDISRLLSYGQAQLYFNGGKLIAKAPAFSFEVAAKGEWWEVARIPLQFLYDLKRELLEGDIVKIRSDGGRVWFNNFSVTASFQSGVYDDYPIDIDAKLIDILRARRTLGEEKLIRSGLHPMVKVAMIEFCDLIQLMWDKSGAHFEKQGISQRDFRKFVLNGI